MGATVCLQWVESSDFTITHNDATYARILLLGLDGAGKSTILYRLKLG